jgi:hypothetical protein
LTILVSVNGVVDDAGDDAETLLRPMILMRLMFLLADLLEEILVCQFWLRLLLARGFRGEHFRRRCYLVVTQTFGLAFACRHERSFLLLRKLA